MVLDPAGNLYRAVDDMRTAKITAIHHRHKYYMIKLEMWANAQRDGRPAEHRWRPLFNAAVWLTPSTRCRAVTLPRRKTR